MKGVIYKAFNDLARVAEDFYQRNQDALVDVVNLLVGTFENGRKVLLFGNGGSAADAQHLAAEFINRLRLDRKPLPALSLSTDTSVLTSVANDTGFEKVFARQVEAHRRVVGEGIDEQQAARLDLPHHHLHAQLPCGCLWPVANPAHSHDMPQGAPRRKPAGTQR